MRDQITPENPSVDLSIPHGPDLEALYQDYLRSDASDGFRLPAPPVNAHEEEVVLAAAQDGRAEYWVRSLLDRANPEAAARIALDWLVSFGEPNDYAVDAWRPEGHFGRDGAATPSSGTHPLLNALRRALLSRMTDRSVTPQSRLRCGDLLGSLGGDPRFEICGKALVLKDEYWQWVGVPGESFSFLMGDMEIPFSWTPERELLELSIPSFKMSGLLVTNAQYLCFADSEEFTEPNWWPYGWMPNNARGGFDAHFGPIPWSLKCNRGGIEPVRCNYLQAYAYGLWERAQRIENTGRRAMIELRMPSDAELEAAFRSHPDNDPLAERATDGRWRFPYTPGKLDPRTRQYSDVRPWHFNHGEIVGMRASPVGMWPESAVGQLQDLSGNLWSWTTSAHTELIEKEAATGLRQPNKEDSFCQVAARSGCYDCSASRCSSGSRGESLVLSIDPDFGFRMVIQESKTNAQGSAAPTSDEEPLVQSLNESNFMDFFGKVNDDWHAATKKGITQVPLELASVASCENCAHYNPVDFQCTTHQQGVNKDSWTCDQFARSEYSQEVGGIYDGVPWSCAIPPGELIESVPIAIDGAMEGDADCCFAIGCLLCDPVTRGMLSVVLAPGEPIREDTHVIFNELTDQIAPDNLKPNDPRKWYHKAAHDYHRLTPGAKMAQRVLDTNVKSKDRIKNIIDCKKYLNSIVERSDYFQRLLEK